MAENIEKDSDSTNKPKFNKMMIGLAGVIGIFFIVMIIGLVLILKMPTSVPDEAVPSSSLEAEKATVKEEVKVAQNTEKSEKSEKSDEKKHGGPANKPQFYKLRPVMVVNIPSADKTRFLQVDVELMVKNSSGVENIEAYAPIIRNDLIILFSTQRYEDLLTLEGKELLRKKALETVQKVMKQNTGDTTVDQVLFTNFVSQ